MKLYIGPYRDWIGPYQIAEKLLFWRNKNSDAVYKFGRFLAGSEEKPSILNRFLEWIHSFKKRKVKIKLHPYDTWNMDETLSIIILPLLLQLKEQKPGSPNVDLEDVPEDLRVDYSKNLEYNQQQAFDFYADDEFEHTEMDIHARWEWVLNEIIWTFEQLHPSNNWQEQYYSGKLSLDKKQLDDSNLVELVESKNSTFKIDHEGLNNHQNRIDNGLKLFGKYYQALWS
jgi:hypothetical protein